MASLYPHLSRSTCMAFADYPVTASSSLQSRGVLVALVQAASCGMSFGSHSLRHRRGTSTAPVITWASRSTARTASSLASAALARQVLHPLLTVRVAVHPGDVTKDSVLSSIETTLRCFAKSRQARSYQSLLTAPRVE